MQGAAPVAARHEERLCLRGQIQICRIHFAEQHDLAAAHARFCGGARGATAVSRAGGGQIHEVVKARAQNARVDVRRRHIGKGCAARARAVKAAEAARKAAARDGQRKVAVDAACRAVLHGGYPAAQKAAARDRDRKIALDMLIVGNRRVIARSADAENAAGETAARDNEAAVPFQCVKTGHRNHRIRCGVRRCPRKAAARDDKAHTADGADRLPLAASEGAACKRAPGAARDLYRKVRKAQGLVGLARASGIGTAVDGGRCADIACARICAECEVVPAAENLRTALAKVQREPLYGNIAAEIQIAAEAEAGIPRRRERKRARRGKFCVRLQRDIARKDDFTAAVQSRCCARQRPKRRGGTAHGAVAAAVRDIDRPRRLGGQQPKRAKKRQKEKYPYMPVYHNSLRKKTARRGKPCRADIFVKSRLVLTDCLLFVACVT